ncbi:UPF0061-domain-containing protein [Ascodesmis nigricans]|uniref:Selenoprotein O n=1 Tax=Ascodesmis nigricans TaxID=341454 RepID=A0A4S2N1W1_9PEZI|nr:UPF0061-domain-containing protein [Ascodesmis nigricans]
MSSAPLHNSTTTGTHTIQSLPKSHVFTSKLPADPRFPTPESSAAAPRASLGPRQVKEAVFTYVAPTPPGNTPQILAVSPLALKTLNLSSSVADDSTFLSLVSGAPTGFESTHYPWAQCYGGWQFGQWAGQLGDGRAISLFEAIPRQEERPEERYEIQLKGSGMTPYSRFADGKAVLRSSIREFVVSEYLHAIGIPTTRALALTLRTGETAVRERVEPTAVVTRFAESWIRIGTFDLLRFRGDRERLRALTDYVLEEVLKLPRAVEVNGGEGKEEENRYWRMYKEIVRRNAETVAKWQVYGFMNGVLNTDNTSVLGLSLDFGPFAFMDNFDPSYTPNHDDHLLRYSYKNQPTIIWWNLVRLGEDLAELFASENPDDPEFMANGFSDAPESKIQALITKAEALIQQAGDLYKSAFLEEYQKVFRRRLGLKDGKEDDMDKFFPDLLTILESGSLDFHHFFRTLATTPLFSTSISALTAALLGPDSVPKEVANQLKSWLSTQYLPRLRESQYPSASSDDSITPEQEVALSDELKKWNPKFVPRSWVLDEVIKKCEKAEKDGEWEAGKRVLEEVMRMVERPGEENWDGIDEARAERWCGIVPKEGRAAQCSCSS